MEYKVDLVDRNQLLKKIEMFTLQNKRREFFLEFEKCLDKNELKGRQ